MTAPCWVIKDGRPLGSGWYLSGWFINGSSWTSFQENAQKFATRAEAEEMSGRLGGKRIVRLVPKRKAERVVYLGPQMVAARVAEAQDQARAEEREAVAKEAYAFIDRAAPGHTDPGSGACPRCDMLKVYNAIRSGAHLAGKAK